jgi:hypothetical protein
MGNGKNGSKNGNGSAKNDNSNGNKLYYGDNLDILQRYVKDESVDLS